MPQFIPEHTPVGWTRPDSYFELGGESETVIVVEESHWAVGLGFMDRHTRERRNRLARRR